MEAFPLHMLLFYFTRRKLLCNRFFEKNREGGKGGEE